MQETHHTALLEQHPKDAGFVKQQDSADLIEKVEKFLHLSYEERKAMGLAARQKVEREFDRKIIVDAYLKAVADIKAKII